MFGGGCDDNSDIRCLVVVLMIVTDGGGGFDVLNPLLKQVK